MRISDLNWMQVERQVLQDDRCLLPLGCTEQHAYLSLSTDSILAERIALEAAEPLNLPVFPVIPFGMTPSFAAYPGTVHIPWEAYFAYLKAVLQSLAQQGFRRILIVNGHGGNTPGREAARELSALGEAQIAWHDWWNAPKTMAMVESIDPAATHASWMENFPWTRLAGIESPPESKPLVQAASISMMDAVDARGVLGDGSYGGLYQRDDKEMLLIWKTAVEETRERLSF